jgi:dihydroorotase
MTFRTQETILNEAKEKGWSVFPGFCDVHVHFREPGFSYKETIATGTLAAARGGFTAVCPMPNLDPVPASLEELNVQLDIIKRDALIACVPYGSITRGERGEELADFEAMAPYVVGYTDDGKGVQSEDMLREAMLRAKYLGRLIVQHCEDSSLNRHGWIHDGEYARLHGHTGIPSESEWRQVERDLKLAKETGCAYHICHITTKESVELVRRAKAEGVNVSCEAMPHNLLMDDMMLQEDGRFKMNPPIRAKDDREALVEGLLDGTIDMIATDHAPHSAEEKSRGLEKSAFGVVGLEPASPLLYTYLVKEGVIGLDRLLHLMTDAPRKRFGIQAGEGCTVWDMESVYRIDPAEFLSKGKATPFEGWQVSGRCMATVYNGKAVYEY